jgi:FKBP-type peptidyl-prolyl cis-trans isomerase SlyD
MRVAKDTVVSLSYQLLGADGKLIERTEAPISYLHGGYDGIFPRVEAELHGKSAGHACEVRLEPDDAFGDYDAQLVRVEPRRSFPPSLKVGMQFEGSSDTSGETRVYTVTDIAEDKVVMDGNHPLAGQALVFSCVVTEVRAASAEEITHGHVHGAHGLHAH